MLFVIYFNSYLLKTMSSLIEKIDASLKHKGYYHYQIKTKDDLVNLTINQFICKGIDARVYNISEINKLKLCGVNIVGKIIDHNVSGMLNKIQDDILNINHKNIEKLFGIYITDVYSFLICEKLDNTICKMNLSLNQIIKVALDITDALIFLHSKHNIAHCDVKENNIMFSSNSRSFKLIDFNNACRESEFRRFKLKVTLMKKPKRLFLNQYDWGYYVDLWALGASLYSVYFGHDMLMEYKGLKYITNDECIPQYIANEIVQFYDKKINELKGERLFFYFFLTSTNATDLRNILKFYHNKT